MKKTILLLIGIGMANQAAASANSNSHIKNRIISSETLSQSTLRCVATIGLLKECGQVYDVQIKEKIVAGLPSHVILRTSKKLEITMPWRYLMGGPSNVTWKYNKSLAPKAAPRLYAALSSLNDWSIVVYNRNENGELLTELKMEVYKNVYAEKEA